MDRVADLLPVEVGLNTTSRVFELPGAMIREEALSFWIENWPVPPVIAVSYTHLTLPTSDLV